RMRPGRLEPHHRFIFAIDAALGHGAERTQLFIRASLQRHHPPIREVNEDFETLTGRDSKLPDRDWPAEHPRVGRDNVKRPAVAEAQVEIPRVRPVENAQPHPATWDSGNRANRAVNDDRIAPASIGHAQRAWAIDK